MLKTAQREAFERLQQDFFELEDWLKTNDPSPPYDATEPKPLPNCHPMDFYEFHEDAKVRLLVLVKRGNRLLPPDLSLDPPDWNGFLRRYCPLRFPNPRKVADTGPGDGERQSRLQELADLYDAYEGIPPMPPQEERVTLDAVPGGIPLRDLSFPESCHASIAAIDKFLDEDAAVLKTPDEEDWQFAPGTATYKGKNIPLTGIDWKLLKALVESEMPLTADDLTNVGWQNDDCERKTLRAHLSQIRQLLRRKLDRAKDFDPIPRRDRGELLAWELNPELR